MSQPLQLVAIITTLALVAIVFDLIRRRRITDELWFTWILASAGPLVCSIWFEPWTRLAQLLGVHYEPFLLLAAGLFFAMALLLHLTTVISSLLRQNQQLAQQVARLSWRLDRLEPTPDAG